MTGHLHLGHLVNAVYVWGIARALGGTVLLRLEDHDRGRFRPEYESSILDDLDWLGLTPDMGSTAEFRAGTSPFRQSDNGDRYRDALELLRAPDLVYVCDCRRGDLVPEGEVTGEETHYAGTCRTKDLDDGAHRRLRLRMEPGDERFIDLRLGSERQDPSQQCGDLVLRDAAGDWTYQFAVTVDDQIQEIGLVIRGEDLLASTGRQIRLSRLLGRSAPPAFFHHPLVVDASGRKLSKRDFSKALRDHRAEGRTPGSL
ncbi:MAG: glutamate--tRNA ligase family protein, partial [Gemmatimonadales bacterium]